MIEGSHNYTMAYERTVIEGCSALILKVTARIYKYILAEGG